VVAPLVLVPPIQIGSLSNVPAPGSQIAAQWAQDASGLLLHRFASKASLDGWAAPNGAYAATTDGILWRRVAGAWSRVTPWSATTLGTGPPGSAGTFTIATINVPADPGPRLITASCFLRIDKYGPAAPMFVRLLLNGVAVVEATLPTTVDIKPFSGEALTHNVALNFTATEVSPASVTLQFQSPVGSGNYIGFSGATVNRLDVTVMPRNN
jgi:hypothetical protein